MSTRISNYDDVIDSREIIGRIEELESNDHSTKSEDDELAVLQEMAEEGSSYSVDWELGETLIRDSYFTNYAQELADDIGAVNQDVNWPNSHIDWDAAADELKTNYTTIDFDGVSYWMRMS